MMAEDTRTLTHIGASGEAHMVDVGDKTETVRIALAEGFIRMAPATLDLILKGDAKKGDVVGPFQVDGGWVVLKVEDRRLEDPITLEDLSGEFDISRERVRQIEVRAFEKVQDAVKKSAASQAKALRVMESA